MHRGAAVLLFSAVGCAQLAGIDETTGGDPPRDVASLRIQHVSVGSTVIAGAEDLSGLTATYLVPDATAPQGLNRVAATLNGPDTWEAEVDGTPPVMFYMPELTPPGRSPVPRVWDFGTRTMYGPFVLLEHPSSMPPPEPAMLTVQAMLPAGGFVGSEGFALYTVGSWTDRPFSTADVNFPTTPGQPTFGPVTFDYRSSTSRSGLPFVKIVASDTVLLLRYLGSALTGVMEAAPFTQTGNDLISGTMVDVVANQTLDVTVHPMAAAARFDRPRPATTTVAMGWALSAAPGAAYTLTQGPVLQGAGVVPTDPTLVINAPYGNPFASKGWRSTLLWNVNATRMYAPPSRPPITLSAGLQQFVEPSAGLMLDLPAGLPESIVFDGVPLTQDGLTLPAPTRAVTVTFLSNIIDNTLYRLDVYELVVNEATTGHDYVRRLAMTSIKPEFVIPPEVFESGDHLYTLRAHCVQGGHPTLDDGDITNRALPMTLGYLDSGVFQVGP
ncbi:MAG: hypothetical protein AB7P03_01305 [Kofleriaceae bacterium]